MQEGKGCMDADSGRCVDADADEAGHAAAVLTARHACTAPAAALATNQGQRPLCRSRGEDEHARGVHASALDNTVQPAVDASVAQPGQASSEAKNRQAQQEQKESHARSASHPMEHHSQRCAQKQKWHSAAPPDAIDEEGECLGDTDKHKDAHGRHGEAGDGAAPAVEHRQHAANSANAPAWSVDAVVPPTPSASAASQHAAAVARPAKGGNQRDDDGDGDRDPRTGSTTGSGHSHNDMKREQGCDAKYALACEGDVARDASLHGEQPPSPARTAPPAAGALLDLLACANQHRHEEDHAAVGPVVAACGAQGATADANGTAASAGCLAAATPNATRAARAAAYAFQCAGPRGSMPPEAAAEEDEEEVEGEERAEECQSAHQVEHAHRADERQAREPESVAAAAAAAPAPLTTIGVGASSQSSGSSSVSPQRGTSSGSMARHVSSAAHCGEPEPEPEPERVRVRDGAAPSGSPRPAAVVDTPRCTNESADDTGHDHAQTRSNASHGEAVVDAREPSIGSPDQDVHRATGGRHGGSGDTTTAEDEHDGDADDDDWRKQPLVTSRIQVDAELDERTGRVRVDLYHAEGDDAEAVWRARREALRKLIPRLDRIRGAAHLAAAARAKVAYDGPHDAFETDRGYISARLLVNLEALVRMDMVVRDKLRSIEPSEFGTLWPEEKARIESEVRDAHIKAYMRRRMEALVARVCSGEIKVQNMPASADAVRPATPPADGEPPATPFATATSGSASASAPQPTPSSSYASSFAHVPPCATTATSVGGGGGGCAPARRLPRARPAPVQTPSRRRSTLH